MTSAFKKIKYVLLALILLFSIETMNPPQTHAQYFTTDLGDIIENTFDVLYSAYQEVVAEYLSLKETVLDPLAWAIAKALIQTMVGSVVNWINSGFQGSPSFLSNPQGFFENIGDQATGAFISKTGILSGLCSPFSVDVKLALALGQVGNSQQYTCTLDSVINNIGNSTINGKSINGFMGGDFSQGGWPAFMALSQSNNNESSAYLEAHSDLLQKIGLQQGQKQQELGQGGGFLSFEKCDDITASINGGGVTTPQYFDSLGLSSAQQATLQKNNVGTYTTSNGGSIKQTYDATGQHYQECKTETPGSVIAASLNKSLGAGQDSLVTADEIDEVIGALIGQLMNTVLDNGLSSASQPSSNYAQSYVNSMMTDTSGDVISGQVGKAVTPTLNEYLTNTENYKAVYDTDVSDIQSVSDTYTSILGMCQASNNQSMALQVQSVIDGQITPLLTTYQEKDDNAATTLSNLQDMQSAINEATSTEALNAATQNFNSLLSNGGSVIKLTDIQDAKTDAKTLEATLTDLQNQSLTYESACATATATSTPSQ